MSLPFNVLSVIPAIMSLYVPSNIKSIILFVSWINGDLVRVDDEDSDIEVKAYSIVATWNWQKQNYYVK